MWYRENHLQVFFLSWLSLTSLSDIVRSNMFCRLPWLQRSIQRKLCHSWGSHKGVESSGSKRCRVWDQYIISYITRLASWIPLQRGTNLYLHSVIMNYHFFPSTVMFFSYYNIGFTAIEFQLLFIYFARCWSYFKKVLIISKLRLFLCFSLFCVRVRLGSEPQKVQNKGKLLKRLFL
jgi:hypothetical protein